MKKSKYKKKYWYMSVPGHRPMSWSGSSSRPWSWSAGSLFGAWSWSGSGSLFGCVSGANDSIISRSGESKYF